MTTSVTMPIAFIKAEFNGRDGQGVISVPGVKVGDMVIATTANGYNSIFQRSLAVFVTTDDEIFQHDASNLEGEPFVLLLLRGV